MPHEPEWHLLDSDFAEQNDGLPAPTRTLGVARTALVVPECSTGNSHQVCAQDFTLQITNLDRADPPDYQPGSMPRAEAFNENVLRITSEPRMPLIQVDCQVQGFDPRTTPIHWRLVCRHVLCRHVNHGQYRYRGICETFEDEWQGRSFTNRFALFYPSSHPALVYDYNTNDPDVPVMGGHAILSVAARPPESSATLLDYVHLRIGATNPERSGVLRYIQRQLRTRDPNIVHMVRAVFAHESDFTQFREGRQTRARMRFRQVHHANNADQPDCSVIFNWPDDPPNYPLATFDFGVGISQYTRLQNRSVSREVAWDWRENIKIGLNLFLSNLRATHRAGLTWRQWAWRAWRRYNGSGPQATAYADSLQASPEGQQVSDQAIPATLNVQEQTAALDEPPAREAAPAWPPEALSAPGEPVH